MKRSTEALITRRSRLIARAMRLDDAGRWARAERVWQSVKRTDRALCERQRNEAGDA